MQTSLESISTSEDSPLQKNNHFKERAIDLINRTEVCEKDLVEFSLELRANPEIEVQANENLLTNDSFEIMQKSKLNPIFVFNLINIINIVNFVWNASKKTIDIFHKVLLELDIIFSYLENGEQIEYTLLSTIPLKFYEMIAEKGKNWFKNDYLFDESFLCSDRNISQIGLVYEESTIVQLNSLLDNKQIIAPRIMYYINHSTCKRLFEQSIFNRPENFLQLEKYTYNPKFHGYNEIDYSFILKEGAELSQNFIFNKVMENDKIQKYFNPNEEEKIKLPKDTNIFVEIKTAFNSPDLINDLKKDADRFANAYCNLAYNGLEKKYVKDKREYYLLYNNKREEALHYLPEKSTNKDKDKTLNKETKVLYNSNYVQIASIASLQNQIRSINYKLAISEKEKAQMKEDMESKMNSMESKIQDQNNELKDLKDQNKKMKEEMELKYKEQEDKIKKISAQNEIILFKTSNQVTLEVLVKNLVNGDNKPSSYYNIFLQMNKKYAELCSKVLENDNKIINVANKVIGEFILLGDEIKNFFEFLSLLNEKISKNTFVSCYYQAFKEMLLGKEWKSSYTPENLNKFDINLPKPTREIAKSILKFIVMLELSEELENNFFEAVLFYVTLLDDITYGTVFYLCSNPKDPKKTTINFIKILNNQLHDSLMPKLK